MANPRNFPGNPPEVPRKSRGNPVDIPPIPLVEALR